MFGQRSSCFCLRPTSQRELCLARSCPAAAKGGDVSWHLGRVSPLGCFQNVRKRRKTNHSRSDHGIPSRPEEPGNKASFSEWRDPSTSFKVSREKQTLAAELIRAPGLAEAEVLGLQYEHHAASDRAHCASFPQMSCEPGGFKKSIHIFSSSSL